MTNDLKTILPEVNEQTVREAYAEKGQFKKETKEDLLSKEQEFLAELKTINDLELNKRVLENVQSLKELPKNESKKAISDLQQQYKDDIAALKKKLATNDKVKDIEERIAALENESKLFSNAVKYKENDINEALKQAKINLEEAYVKDRKSVV